jgi:hypothetical protein
MPRAIYSLFTMVAMERLRVLDRTNGCAIQLQILPRSIWSAIQTLLGTAVSDVLVLLDYCAAASSAAGSGLGSMEAIAACGWGTRAPPPGEYSFTHTLIEALEDWISKPSFSAAMLHTELLFVLKQKRP